jgi:hypothetical protein
MSDTPLLPAFYFGSVEHYRLIAQRGKVIIDTGEHYERQSYRTRTTIVGPNGRQDLVVQIARRSGEKMPMHTVGLSYVESWPQQHVHAIRSAYGNTPWFIHYIDDIEAVVLKKYDRLVDLDLATLRLGMNWLGLRAEVQLSETYVEVGGHGYESGPTTHDLSSAPDLRNSFHPKKQLPPEITEVPPYPQIFADRHGFVERMSVIDLVMNAGPEARRSLLA